MSPCFRRIIVKFSLSGMLIRMFMFISQRMGSLFASDVVFVYINSEDNAIHSVRFVFFLIFILHQRQNAYHSFAFNWQFAHTLTTFSIAHWLVYKFFVSNTQQFQLVSFGYHDYFVFIFARSFINTFLKKMDIWH